MFAPLLFAVSWPASLTGAIIAPQIAAAVCGEARDPPSADSILVEWEQHAPAIEHALVELTCYQYDEVFSIEERSQVTLHFEPGSRYLYRIAPVALPDDAVSTKQDGTGKRYQLTTCSRTTWYADTQSLVQIDHSTKTYGSSQFPPGTSPCDLRLVLDSRRPGIIEALTNWTLTATSFFGLHAALASGTQIDVLCSQLTWSVGPRSGADRIYLIAEPHGGATQHFQRLDILLDADTWQTIAFRFIDPAGSKETVFVVNKMQLNDAVPKFHRPDLRGYSLHAPSSDRTPEAPDVKDIASHWRPVLLRKLLMGFGIWW